MRDKVAENEAFFVVISNSRTRRKETACSEVPKARAQDVGHVHARYVKDSSGTAKQTKAGGNSLSETNEKSMTGNILNAK